MSSYGNLISVIVPIWLLLLWLNHGGDLGNRRFAASEYLINPSTVRNLRLRWKFFTGRDISATPAVAGGIVYFPSWNGNMYAVNAFTGDLIWQQNIGQLTGLPGTGVSVNVSVSRTTPVVTRNLLIVGIYGPAIVIAVDRISGRLVWLTTIDPRPLALITASGTVYSRSVNSETSPKAVRWSLMRSLATILVCLIFGFGSAQKLGWVKSELVRWVGPEIRFFSKTSSFNIRIININKQK
ncbi:putative alcohol dehydrogenase (cytochrome c) [Helianthus debilis subsp. tardiflorus]